MQILLEVSAWAAGPGGLLVLGLVLVAGLAVGLADRRRVRTRHPAEQQFESLIAELKDHTVLTLDPDGRVVSWNDGAERINGYQDNEIIGRHSSCFYPSEDLDMGKLEAGLLAAAAQERYEGEGWRIRKDGSRFWARTIVTALRDPQKRLTGYLEITRDLERERAEEQEKVILVVENTGDFVGIADLHQRVIFVNRAGQVMVGLDGDEQARRTQIVDYFPEESRDEMKHRQLPLVLKDGRVEAEVKLRHFKTGELIPVLWSASVMEDPASGSPRFYSFTARDIIEKKRAEEDAKKRAEEARRAKQVEGESAKLNEELCARNAELVRSNADLQQFIHIVSHDLQESLRMTADYMQTIAEQYKGKLDADADEYLGYVADGALRMRQLISDLLAYSRAQEDSVEPSPTDCGVALDEVRANLDLAIRESSAVISSDPDPLPIVMADPSQMLQLLENLIANAIKFRSPASPHIHVSAHRTGDRWLFSVSDNGIGMEPRYKESVFLFFQRLHDPRRYPGNGIGLAICKKIVESLGGRIWVESEAGKGSTFFFTLPSFAQHEPSLEKAENGETAPA